jgi:enoyl-CoA hydratase/carnithine racemase
MTDTYQTLRVATQLGAATVTIDNPPLNIVDGTLLTDLDAFAGRVRDDREVKVIIFQSADPDFFLPHGDMNFVDDPEAFAALAVAREQSSDLNPMQRMFERVRQLPQITIGKLAGFARGGGAEFLAALDMRFAGRDRGKLAQMEVSTGIIPGAGATAYMPPLLGRARTLEVIFGAALFDATTAERYGWINRAIPDDELDGFVINLARRIGRLDFDQIIAGKTAVDAGLPTLTEALIVQNRELGKVFVAPKAAALTRAALMEGAQTREGEKELEALLDRLWQEA